MKGNSIVGILAISIVSLQCGFSQGTFVNLDFENPILPLNPVNNQISISNALPGWTGYIGGVQVNQITYNTVPLGDAAITLQGPGSSISAIQGQYTVDLFSYFNPSQLPNAPNAEIAQTGQIPQNARSLIFYSNPGGTSLDAMFNGQMIPLVQLGSTPNYSIIGGDISAFAGQTGQLDFIAPSVGTGTSGLLDDIQFSPNSVPEPGTWAILLGGAATLFATSRWKRRT